MRKGKINRKKLRDELLALVGVILGVAWFILGITKTVPGMETTLTKIVSLIISIGPIGGLFIASLAVFYFIDVIDTEYLRDEAR